jgi:hypothetical protein
LVAALLGSARSLITHNLSTTPLLCCPLRRAAPSYLFQTLPTVCVPPAPGASSLPPALPLPSSGLDLYFCLCAPLLSLHLSALAGVDHPGLLPVPSTSSSSSFPVGRCLYSRSTSTTARSPPHRSGYTYLLVFTRTYTRYFYLSSSVLGFAWRGHPSAVLVCILGRLLGTDKVRRQRAFSTVRTESSQRSWPSRISPLVGQEQRHNKPLLTDSSSGGDSRAAETGAARVGSRQPDG